MCEHVAASLRKEREEIRLRHYITEALRILTENTTHFLIPGVGDVSFGSYIQNPWFSMAKQAQKDRKPPKSAEEIAEDVIRRAGLKIKEGPDNG